MGRCFSCVLLVVAALACDPKDTDSVEAKTGGDSGSAVTEPTPDTGTDDSASPLGDTAESVESCEPLSWPAHIPQMANATLPIIGSTTELWTVTLPEGSALGALAIGVWPDGTDEGNRACYQLNRVTADGEVWVHPPDDPIDQGLHCLTCPERVAVRQGMGWYVFPAAESSAGVRELAVEVSVRECTTGTPALVELGDPVPETVQVSVGAVAASAGEAITIPIHLINASTFDVEAMVDSAIESAGLQFAEHGIDLAVTGVTRLELSESSVSYDGAERTALRSLLAQAAEAADGAEATGGIPVVLVDCLERTGLNSGRPEGMATSIPGMPSTECLPDGVFLRMAQCLGPDPFAYPWSTESLGKVLAHEMGHFMGLYHSVEANGTEDHLADTDANNLMHYRALNSSSTGLTESQATVIRTHAMLLQSGLTAD